jgi:hypothetical protein
LRKRNSWLCLFNIIIIREGRKEGRKEVRIDKLLRQLIKFKNDDHLTETTTAKICLASKEARHS